MAVDRYTILSALASRETVTAEDIIIGMMKEFSHEIESELREVIKGNRKDWQAGVAEETIKVTYDYDAESQSGKDLKKAIQLGLQLRIWIINHELDKQNKHNAIFAYAIPASHEFGVDDESEKVEVELKVKLNSAEGKETKLPDSILDPSTAGAVEYESVNQYHGDLEKREKSATKGSADTTGVSGTPKTTDTH